MFLNYPYQPIIGGGKQTPQLCLKVLLITLTTSAKSRLTTLSHSKAEVEGGIVMYIFVGDGND